MTATDTPAAGDNNPTLVAMLKSLSLEQLKEIVVVARYVRAEATVNGTLLATITPEMHREAIEYLASNEMPPELATFRAARAKQA